MPIHIEDITSELSAAGFTVKKFVNEDDRILLSVRSNTTERLYAHYCMAQQFQAQFPGWVKLISQRDKQ